MSGWLAVLPAKGVKETRPRSRRNEEIGRKEVGVFSAVTTPIHIVSHLSADPRTGIDDRFLTYDLELKEF